MRIAGLVKCSLVDYPGKVAAVIFTPGCNMNCHYCHNRGLIDPGAGAEELATDEVLDFLHLRRRLLEGLVVSGGEPTLQPGLADFLRQVRPLGLAIKLDTNGTRPSVVASLLDEELVDFVAMDLKAPRERYPEICQVPVDLEAVDQTVELLRTRGVDHEFRTTFTPLLAENDIRAVAGLVPRDDKLVLQQFRRTEATGRERQPLAPYSPDFVRAVAGRLRTDCGIACVTRGI